jgi:ABC-type multidrug transport system fused ATPase/permease subunit
MLPRLFARFALKHPWLVAASVAFMALTPINDVLVPHLYGKIMEKIQQVKSDGFARSLAMLVAVIAAVQVGNLLSDILNARFLPAWEYFVRDDLLNRVFQKYEQDHRDLATGELLAQIENAPSLIVYWFSSIKDYFLPYLLMILSATFYFLRQDAVIGWTFLAMAGTVAALFASTPLRCKDASTSVNAWHNAVHESIEDVLRNIVSVFDGNQQDAELRRLSEHGLLYQEKLARAMMCVLTSKMIAIPLLVGFLITFILRCRRLILDKCLKPAKFVSLFMIVTNMLTNLSWVIDVMRNASLDYGVLVQLEKTLGDEAIGKSPRARIDVPVLPPYADGVGLVGVTFGYPHAKRPVLRGATVHFAPGEKTALVGGVGSGKSTVLKVLFKLVRPQAGDAYSYGRWYADLNGGDLRRGVAYFPQVPALFDRTILENILYGIPDASEAEAIALMRRYDVLGEFDGLKDGVRSKAGKNGSGISGGQRQLVWTLRAILQRPRVMLFDEPTSSMDDGTKRKFEAIVQGYLGSNPSTVVVMVTHDPYLKGLATRTVRMEDIQSSQNNI